MKKILLIEDVTERQKEFMYDQDFTLDAYSEILENAIDDKYKKISLNLNINTATLENYSVIMVHKSAFEHESGITINKIEQHCKQNKTPLVLFSGSLGNYYNNAQYDYLELNSKDFYSQNLKLFLDEYRKGSENILMLSYGSGWILNTLLNVLEKTNIFLRKNKDSDIIYSEFENFTKINELTNIDHTFYEVVVDNDWTTPKEIKKKRDSILKYIQEISNV